MKGHQHEYYGGVCLCGKKQPVFSNGKEQGLSNIKYERKTPQKRVFSEFQYVVSEVISYLGEDDKMFPKYCGIIKKVGINQARIWIKEMRQRGISSPKYFMGIYKNFNQSKK